MARIRFAQGARRDLREILDYLRDYAPAVMNRTGAGLQASIERLSQFPELGRLVHQDEGAQFRRLVAGDFIIWYRLRPGGDILVLSFRHVRRRPLSVDELERRAAGSPDEENHFRRAD